MAIAIVQTTAKQRTDSGTTLSFSITVSAGSHIFVPVSARRSAGVNSGISVSDSDGTYTVDANRSQSTARSTLHRLNNASGGTHNITVDAIDSGTDIVACAIEVTGLDAVPLDKTSVNGAVSTSVSSGATATTTVANELLIGVMTIANNEASITVESLSPAWVEQYEELSNATYVPGEADTRLVTATGAYTANWTASTSGAWAAVIATYKESSGGGGGSGFGTVMEGGVFGGRVIR